MVHREIAVPSIPGSWKDHWEKEKGARLGEEGLC